MSESKVPPNRLHFLLIDDHHLLRQGLRTVLSLHFENLSITEASNAQEAIERSLAGSWQLIILDLNLPGRGGLDLLRELRNRFPGTPIIILSSYPEEQLALRVLKLGASSYIQKSGPSEDLIASVEAALKGRKYITPSIAQRLASYLEDDQPSTAHEALSDREFQVMRLLALGKTVKEISQELSLSVKTISTYRIRILEKMRLCNNSQLMHYAMRHQMLEAELV